MKTGVNMNVQVPGWDVLDDEMDEEFCESDYFRMFEFKVRSCMRGRSHEWTECPFTHPGEKARRRDPRKFVYSGNPCPEFRKGNCKKGDLCEYAHGVFESWLHPSRYRTQPCKDGLNCRRQICFFAHSPDQLRILTPKTARMLPYSFSPESMSPQPQSPPSLSALTNSLRQLQLSISPPVCGSNRSSMARPEFFSLPTTPIRGRALGGIWPMDEEPVMERVESGRGLRAKMLEKLSRENFVDSKPMDPDVGWVSDLLK